MEINIDLFIEFDKSYLTLINNFNEFNNKFEIKYIYDLECKKYYCEYNNEFIFIDLKKLYEDLIIFINQLINLFENQKIILDEINNIKNKMNKISYVNDKITYFYLLIRDIKQLKNNLKIKI